MKMLKTRKATPMTMKARPLVRSDSSLSNMRAMMSTQSRAAPKRGAPRRPGELQHDERDADEERCSVMSQGRTAWAVSPKTTKASTGVMAMEATDKHRPAMRREDRMNAQRRR
jgi:hypothetical protein